MHKPLTTSLVFKQNEVVANQTENLPKKLGRPTKAEARAKAPRCGKTNRLGQPCSRPAGWGVPGASSGPCKLHGGLTPIPTYAMSEDSLESLIQKYENDPDIFNLRREIAMLRALRDQQIERYSSAENSKERNDSLYNLNAILTNIVRAAEKFQHVLIRSNFVMTVAQARQVRESIKNILVEESHALADIVAPLDARIASDLDAWRERVAYRLDTELSLENMPVVEMD
jgi:hypothetical protein